MQCVICGEIFGIVDNDAVRGHLSRMTCSDCREPGADVVERNKRAPWFKPAQSKGLITVWMTTDQLGRK